jgi:hypothetical protein
LAPFFYYQLKDTDEELWFWSEHYKKGLLSMDSITFNDNTVLKIDDILDKVSELGAISLTNAELQFLNSIKEINYLWGSAPR